MSNNNGGPAFPFGQTDSMSGQLVNGWGSEGMTLRDYFAAKAMQGLLSSANFSAEFINEGHIFAAAYKMADAMIKEREK